MIELRFPKLTGNDHEQLEQLKSFLYQHIEQLQFVLNSIDNKLSDINKNDKK